MSTDEQYRAGFEALAREKEMLLTQRASGNYYDNETQIGWEFWTAAKREASTEPSDPMDWPLPCDVKVGAGTIKKGCKLRTLVTRMHMLHRMAMEGLPKVTPEQQAAFFAMFPHLKPADSGAGALTASAENSAISGAGQNGDKTAEARMVAGFEVLGKSACALPDDAKDAARWRFRKQFLENGGAIMFTMANCQFRRAGELVACGATEQDAIDAAIQAHTRAGSDHA
jgi:hypothetical protein